MLRGSVGSSVELLLHRQDGSRNLVTLMRAHPPRPPLQQVGRHLTLKTADTGEQTHVRDPKGSDDVEQQQQQQQHQQQQQQQQHQQQQQQQQQQGSRRSSSSSRASVRRKTVPHRGVGIGLAENGTGGLLIAKLLPGGAAAASGRIQVGDLLQAVQGQSVVGWSKSEVGETPMSR